MVRVARGWAKSQVVRPVAPQSPKESLTQPSKMRSVRAIVTVLALAAAMTSAKNPYKGCGFGGEDDAGEPKVKDCLGWAVGQDENDCMKPEVGWYN